MSFLQILDVAFYAAVITVLPLGYIAVPVLTAAICIGKALEYVTDLFCIEE